MNMSVISLNKKEIEENLEDIKTIAPPVRGLKGVRKMNKNTEIWEAVQKTDPTYIKDVKLGARKFKAIDAYSQIMTATKLWGAYGSSWGVKDENFTFIDTHDNSGAVVLYTALLFYPDGEFPINSDTRINTYVASKDKWKINEDFAKKVSTDALTKGLSKLGFNADVFLGAFDGNKYDGIESLDIDFSVDSDTQSKLSDCIDRLDAAGLPEKANFIRNKLIDGLKQSEALKLIAKSEVMINERN